MLTGSTVPRSARERCRVQSESRRWPLSSPTSGYRQAFCLKSGLVPNLPDLIAPAGIAFSSRTPGSRSTSCARAMTATQVPGCNVFFYYLPALQRRLVSSLDNRLTTQLNFCVPIRTHRSSRMMAPTQFQQMVITGRLFSPIYVAGTDLQRTAD